MPQVLFWNVERVRGWGTDPRIKEMVSWVVDYAIENFSVSDIYLCEVTSDFELLIPSLSHIPRGYQKEGFVQKISSRTTSAQLGYSHISTTEHPPANPAKITLKSHSQVFGMLPGQFGHMVNPIRHLVRHGKNIYVLHANSGKGGGAPYQIIRAWVQIYYDTFSSFPVLFGDLNCEPEFLEQTRKDYIKILNAAFNSNSAIPQVNASSKQWSIAAAIEALEDKDIKAGGTTFKVNSLYYGVDTTRKTYDYVCNNKK